MLSSICACLMAIFGVHEIRWRVVYCLVFFVVSYGFGMLLKDMSGWGYWNPLIPSGWAGLALGGYFVWRVDRASKGG